MWRSAYPTTWHQRFAQHIVRRERAANNLVSIEIEAAERSLARLQLAAGVRGAEEDMEHMELSDCHSQNESTSMVEASWAKSVSFAGGYHPEDRDPMRCGTPAALRTDICGYLADDESEAPRALRVNTQYSRSPDVSLPHLNTPAPTPELLQSPVYPLRALNPSEVWEEEAIAAPILYAPVPLRPLINPEILLLGYYEESLLGQDPTSSSFAEGSLERNMDRRTERIRGLLDDLNKIHDDIDSFLKHRRALLRENGEQVS